MLALLSPSASHLSALPAACTYRCVRLCVSCLRARSVGIYVASSQVPTLEGDVCVGATGATANQKALLGITSAEVPSDGPKRENGGDGGGSASLDQLKVLDSQPTPPDPPRGSS